MRRFSAAFAVLVLLFSASRGLVPILTSDAGTARVAYDASAILGITLSLCGIYLASQAQNDATGRLLRTLLFLNLSLFAWWLMPIMLFNPDPDWLLAPIYSAIFPFSIYALAKVPETTTRHCLAAITLLVAGFVLWEFAELNSGLIAGGLESATKRQELLRPGVYEAWTKTGDFIRPNGLFGFRPHDSGNILAMLSIFWIATALLEGRISQVALGLFSGAALLMTMSASNILAAAIGVLVLLVVVSPPQRFRALLAFLIIILAAYFVGETGGILDAAFAWTRRISPEYGDWAGMTKVGEHTGLSEVFALLFGHGISLELSGFAVNSEIGFIAGYFEYGLLHYSIILYLLAYPIFASLVNHGSRVAAIPYLLPIGVGVLSLWHYGSLLRTTNAFVFFALYAQSLAALNSRSRAHPRKPAPRAVS
jgi:hypothetical protein